MNPFKQLCGKYIFIHIFMMFFSHAQFGVNILLKLNYINRTAVTIGQWNLCSALLCHIMVGHRLATRIRKLADRRVFFRNGRVIPSKALSGPVGINTHPDSDIFMVVVRLILPPPRVAECLSCCLPSPRKRGFHLCARRHSHSHHPSLVF